MSHEPTHAPPLPRLADTDRPLPTDLEKGWGQTVVVTDADGTIRRDVLRDAAQPIHGRGRLRPGGYAAQLPSLVGQLGFFAPPGSDFCYSHRLPGRLYIGLGREGQPIKAGTVMPYRFAIGTFATEDGGDAVLEQHLRGMNLAGGQAGYPLQMKAGAVRDATFFLTLRAQQNEAAASVGPQKLIIDLPVRVTGLENNGCAAVYTNRRPWFRFVPVHKGTAYFQENIEAATELWAGNILVADHPAVKLTVVIDGQVEGQPPVVEVHNPTDRPLTTVLRAPPHTPLLGGLKQTVAVPAGQSVFLRLDTTPSAPLASTSDRAHNGRR